MRGEISLPACVRTRELEKYVPAKKLPESPRSSRAFHKAQGQVKQSSLWFRRTCIYDKATCIPTHGNNKQTEDVVEEGLDQDVSLYS